MKCFLWNASEKHEGGAKEARERIATCMVYGSLLILMSLAIIVIVVAAATDQPNLKDITQNVFNTILPLLGTWVGTVMAYYFSKDNFQTAAESVRQTVQELNPQLEKLRKYMVKDVMVPIGTIKLQALDSANGERKVMINSLINMLGGVVTRIPVLNDKKIAQYIIHQSMLYKFIALKSIEGIKAGKEFKTDDATLEDFLNFEGMKETVASTMAFVSADSNLAEAKSKMDSVSNCQDIFVTEHGKSDEPMLGWITNIDITKHAK